MSTNLVTVQNAPRSVGELINLPKIVRYRLGVSLHMWGGNNEAEEAFLALDDANQAQSLLSALQAWDSGPGQGGGGNGAMPQQQMQPPQQQMQQPQYAQPPQQMPPQQMQPPTTRTPATVSDPTNMGSGQQYPQQQYPQQQQAPQQQQPQQQYSQQQPGAGNQLLSAVGALNGKIDRLHKLVDEEVSGAADLEELKDIVLGMARTQQTIAALVLILSENQIGIPRPAIVKMINSELSKGLKELLEAQGDSPGKG